MSEIDWSKAPEWADRVVRLGVGENLAWACDRKYKYLSGAGPFLFFDDPTDGFMLCQAVVVEGRQRPSPAWSGEGLPPVGAAVDCKCTAKTKARDWFPAEVKYISPYTVVLVDYSTEELDGEFVAHPATLLFQPRRTPEQIATDEREAAITEMVKTIRWPGYISRIQAAELYDAGLRFTKQ